MGWVNRLIKVEPTQFVRWYSVDISNNFKVRLILFKGKTDGSRKKFNVHAKTREECEAELAKMIEQKKKEIAELKKKAKKA